MGFSFGHNATGWRTPALGEVAPDGRVHLHEQWHPEAGPWLPCRVGSGRNTFALRLSPFDPRLDADRWVIFRSLPREQLPEAQDVAVRFKVHQDHHAYFGRLTRMDRCVALHLQDAARSVLEITTADIEQLALAVGNWPPPIGALNQRR